MALLQPSRAAVELGLAASVTDSQAMGPSVALNAEAINPERAFICRASAAESQRAPNSVAAAEEVCASERGWITACGRLPTTLVDDADSTAAHVEQDGQCAAVGSIVAAADLAQVPVPASMCAVPRRGGDRPAVTPAERRHAIGSLNHASCNNDASHL